MHLFIIIIYYIQKTTRQINMASITNINKIQHYAYSRQPRHILARLFFNVFIMLQSPFALSSPRLTTESPANPSHHMSMYTSIFIISSLCVYVALCYLLYRSRQIKSAQEPRPFHAKFSRELLWASIPALITAGLLLLSGAVIHY